MTNNFFPTRAFKEKAAGYLRFVETQINILRRSNDPKSLMERLENLPLYKRRADFLRIIIEERIYPDNNIKIYLLRDLFLRDSIEYENFNRNIRNWFKSNKLGNDEESEILAFVNEIIRKDEESKRLPDLPDHLQTCIENLNCSISESSVYETEEWIENIRNPEVINYRETICDALLKIVDNNFNNLKQKKISDHYQNRNIYLLSLPNQFYILYEKTFFDNSHALIMLYNLYRGNEPTNNELDQVLSKYIDNTNVSSRSDYIRNAKRAYPDIILADSDLWFKIEDDLIANLALSPEEESLMQQASFPLFINGQAGTGKSTMLFYLFANILSKKDCDNSFLFLTYNQKLIDTAKNTVKSLLKTHPEVTGNIEEYFRRLDEMFYPFQKFIIKNFLSDDDKRNFSLDRYISFNKFKQCLLGISDVSTLNCFLPNNRRYSPELVWHTIRSYIKGYDVDKDLTPENFNSIPRKDRSISFEIYKDIYKTIYNNWYKRLFKNYYYWDDLDLIRYVLNHNRINKTYDIIFCDEAQDFTRIEIELIIKLSSYTKFNLTNTNSVPIAFAGDPYQTVNPTGFRWESLKSIFNQKFEKLNPSGIEINYNLLTINYRSKPAIIKFSNFIQALRYKFLNIKELEPQIPWQKIEGVTPCIFIFDDNISINDLTNIADKTIFLIPTEPDENIESKFAREDAEMSMFLRIPEVNEYPIHNIMSASTAKGLEFDRVVVYKFGESIPENFNVLSNINKENINKYIEFSYFFNKLYVAVSRARNYLFIIDSKKGYENFWKYLMTDDTISSLYEENRNWKSEDISCLARGTNIDIQNIKEDNPEKVAQELMQTGMLRENPSLLFRAAQYFKLINKVKEANQCNAWAYWYQENWKKAGDYFLEIKDEKNAFKSFWRAKLWNDIISLFKEQPDNIYVKLSHFMNDNSQVESIINSDIINLSDPLDPIWNEIIAKIGSEINNKLKVSDNKALAMQSASFLYNLSKHGFIGLYDLCAELFYNLHQYELAIDCWDRSGKSTHDKYYNSKLKLTPATDYNQKILWLGKLKEWKEILDLKKRVNLETLNNDSHEAIIHSLLINGKFKEALDYPYLKLNKKLKQLLDYTSEKNTEEGNNLKRDIFNRIIQLGEEGLEILKNNPDQRIKELLKDEENIKFILIQDNWEDIIKEISNEIRLANPGGYIDLMISSIASISEDKSYIQYLNQKIIFSFEILSEIRDQLQKEKNYPKLIKIISRSLFKPDEISDNIVNEVNLFRNYLNLLLETTNDFDHKELAITLERIGGLSIDLQRLYESIFNNKSFDFITRRWAKMRWIKVALRRYEYEKEQGRYDTAKRILDEINTKKKLWKIKDELITKEPEYPFYWKTRRFYYEYEFTNCALKITIEGTNRRININKLNDTSLKFILENLEISINVPMNLLSIKNLITNRTVDVDFLNNEIAGLGVVRDGNNFEINGVFKGIINNDHSINLKIYNKFNINISIFYNN